MCIASFTVVIADSKMSLKNARPLLIAKLGDQAKMECCCGGSEKMNVTWFVQLQKGGVTNYVVLQMPGSVYAINSTGHELTNMTSVNSTEGISFDVRFTSDKSCGTISFKSVKLSDTGMYRCRFIQDNRGISSHGTFLHVYGKCLCVCYDVR